MSNARTRRRDLRRTLWTARDLGVVATMAKEWSYLLDDVPPRAEADRGAIALVTGTRASVARAWAARRCQQCGAPSPSPAAPRATRASGTECPRCHVRTVCFSEID